jgi:hypothetical protein
MSEASMQALSILRSSDNFQWYVIPLLMFVGYVYLQEVERRNWNAVLVGLTFWAGEFIWEMFNSLVLHWSGYAGMWGAPGKTAFLIYSGLNIEISFMFAVYGITLIKVLPADRSLRILGMPNRFIIPVAYGLLGVGVEIVLNRMGALTWDYSWWSWPNVWLIIVAYTLPCWFICWYADNVGNRVKSILLACTIACAILCHIVFAVVLKWV